MEKWIVLKGPKMINQYDVYCDFSFSAELNSFFRTKTFFSKYSREIGNVPKGILIIPALSNICPIAWVSGSDVYVEEIDKTFLESLEKVKKSFQKMYPNLHFTGKIYAKKIINYDHGQGEKHGLLFSGGVDSLASFIRKRFENPILFSVWGADIKLNQKEAWGKVANDISIFSVNNGHKNMFIKSNLRSFLNEKRLKFPSLDSWWKSIQHGLGLLGLCAPLAFAEKMDTVYIAATRWEGNTLPIASHPEIDNHIQWGQTKVIHEGFELSRQDKIQVIGEYIKSTDPSIQIRVCFSSKDGRNCSKCKKCCRTMVGLLLEGIKPNHHGFKMTEETLKNIRSQFEQGKFLTGHAGLALWEDIKRHAMLKKEVIDPKFTDFFHWVLNCDFRAFLK